MHGFKSFPKKTEIPFTSGINVVLGPNGSGKSNISDALCFVLGRLSIKSMRAAKARNLIFLVHRRADQAAEAGGGNFRGVQLFAPEHREHPHRTERYRSSSFYRPVFRRMAEPGEQSRRHFFTRNEPK